MRHRAGWLRWLAANLGLLLVLLPFPLLVVLGVDAVTGWSDARPGTIVDGYVFFVVYLPLTWPVYLVLVAVTSGSVGHPRRWAVALSPVLGLPLLPFLVLVTAPPIAAMWLLYLTYGSLVRLCPHPSC